MRSSDSTTTMRTKLVIMMRMDGAMDSTVTRAMICIMRSVKRPLPLKSMVRPLAAAVPAALAAPAAAPCASAAMRANSTSAKR